MVLAITDLSLDKDRPQHIILREHVLDIGVDLGNRINILFHEQASIPSDRLCEFRKHPVDKTRRFLLPEFLGKLDRLIDRDTCRHIVVKDDLVHGKAQDREVYLPHSLCRPSFCLPVDHRIQLIELFDDPVAFAGNIRGIFVPDLLQFPLLCLRPEVFKEELLLLGHFFPVVKFNPENIFEYLFPKLSSAHLSFP